MSLDIKKEMILISIHRKRDSTPSVHFPGVHYLPLLHEVELRCYLFLLQSSAFHDDIYPPTASLIPSLSADEWISGQTRGQILMSMLVRVRK